MLFLSLPSITVDSIIPVIGILPEDITRTVQLGSPGTVVTWPEPQVSDNSGIVNLVSQSHTPGSFFPVGTTEVTYTYADPSNNRVMVSFDVNVIEGRLSIHQSLNHFNFSL